MAKQSGLGDNFYLGGYDLSGDVGALGRIAGGLAGTQDVTGINAHAFERTGLRRDGGIDWTSFFNPERASDDPPNTEDRAHAVLSTLPTTDRTITYCRGTALGSPAASLIGKQLSYDPTMAADGSLTIAVQSVPNGYGLEWGRLLTAGPRTDTAATNGPSVDFGLGSSGTGPSEFGLQAWLHVFAFTGTDATITLQESGDNGAADSWAAVTGGAFAQVTSGPGAQRIQTARDQTVERYLRVATSGTFSELVFAVVAVRNDTLVEF
ncbi:hypothetical protein [Actinomadura sp. 21ATH]|uniref:hypothetical protein n=1 Tax=Actinomadura sp. 21ATH TaxID=1735444 RepID=UPI0035C0A2F7